MAQQLFGPGRFLASYLVAGASGNLLSAINRCVLYCGYRLYYIALHCACRFVSFVLYCTVLYERFHKLQAYAY